MLAGAEGEMISEPVRVGSLQVPESGQLLAIMRDGPTVGGYPKIGLIHSDDVNWLAQCRPGQAVEFQPAPENDG
jgi:allophanate hydrolase subunit 2